MTAARKPRTGSGLHKPEIQPWEETRTREEPLVIEVKFTTVVDELHLDPDGYGPTMIEAFFASVAKYGKDGKYEIPKIIGGINMRASLADEDKIVLTVEGLSS